MSRQYSLLYALLLMALMVPQLQAQDSDLDAQVAALFARSCTQAGCHSGAFPQMGMDLTAEQFYAATVGVPSQELPNMMRVHPGDPAQSYLIKKVRGDDGIIGLQMPFSGDKLTEAEVQTLVDWVESINAVDEERVAAAPKAPPLPFAGWRVVNAPTTRMVPGGSYLFRISHRFVPPLSTGYDSFYGLDGSGIILMSLGYAPSDDLFVTLGRSNSNDDVELAGRYRIAQQAAAGADGLPVDLGVQTTLNWVSSDVADEGRFSRAAFGFTGQAIVAREIKPGLGVLIAPGITINPSHTSNEDDVLVTLGLGGRWHMHGKMSLMAEWTPILAGYTQTTTLGNVNRFDSWGGGLEIATAGHVFQIVLSNAAALATAQYLNGGDLDIGEGDMRLGFNIYRVLNF